MTDSQKLDVILSELSEMKSEMTEMKSEMTEMKSNTAALKLHIENETDRNISILAENHMNLIDKLNAAIQVSNKNLIYEVQVSGLRSRVDRLEADMKVLKDKAVFA